MRISLAFDLISPYAWLALERIAVESAFKDHEIELRPVVFGALLDHHRLVGPAESAAKRELTFLDVSRCAALLGLGLEGPPAHPFRSLEALRTICLVESGERLDLATRLSRACWAEGRDPCDLDVLAEVSGLASNGSSLGELLCAPAIKQSLIDSTQWAIESGVFGVPSFVLADGELFWGHDRIDHLIARLDGRLDDQRPKAATVLARPQAIRRKNAPGAER